MVDVNEFEIIEEENPLKACDLMCSVDGINRRKDFTATIRLSTERECARDLYHDLVDLQGALARVIIAPESVDPKAPMASDESANKHPGGSLSKRLRSVIWRRWEASAKREHIPFEHYYKNQMEVLIDQQKSLI
jgi:hypothetical protein|tara:strand:- start:619 stop:1020 length:402 start_codon:yes stop_codon:yes gene_type:complete